MEEDKSILFQISRMGESGVSIIGRMNGLDDMFTVCSGIAVVANENENFKLILISALKTAMEHPELLKDNEEDQVEMPDFNELLKNIK